MSGKVESSFFQIKILISIPLILGTLNMFLAPDLTSLEKVVPRGQALIKVKKDKFGNLWGTPVTEYHETSVDHVSLNSSPLKDLVKCPGIGKKMAKLIIRERNAKKFKDWADFSYRIRKLSKTKIEKLKNAGVKIDL